MPSSSTKIASGGRTYTYGFFYKVVFKILLIFDDLNPRPCLSKTHFWIAKIISKDFCPQEKIEKEEVN